MIQSFSRRDFLHTAPAVCTAAGVFGFASFGGDAASGATPTDGTSSKTTVPDGFPSQDAQAVKDVVLFAHFNVDNVKKLVSARPALAKASWDWGFGDWELALGAASHMGRRDIAKVLMDHGARPTFFTFAMLGNLDAVRALIEANPGIQRLAGPHGITLLAHAKVGGAGSKSTVKYLESLGDADIGQQGLPVPSEEHTAIQGVYAFGNGPDERLKVFESKRGLAIERNGYNHRSILRVGPLAYHPTGAPAVRIRFDPTGSRPNSLTIVDAALKVIARRVQG